MAVEHQQNGRDEVLEGQDHGQDPSASFNPSAYTFPNHRLKKVMKDPSKTPLLLVACGSFSPITYLHLRMFEMAADYVKFSTSFELIGGYLSPVSDAYRKAGLASASHRYVIIHIMSSVRGLIADFMTSLESRCVSRLWTRRLIGS